MGALASSNFDSDINILINGYKMCASSEGKSKNSIEIVVNGVYYFYEFLKNSKHINIEITDIVRWTPLLGQERDNIKVESCFN